MPIVALLDTNVWVSALLNSRGVPARIVHAWLDDRFEAVTSVLLLQELSHVLMRPRILRKYALQPLHIELLLEALANHTRVVTPTGTMHLCRDPDDDQVLEAALLGRAQYLVTRDDDLKRVPDLVGHLEARGVRVVSVQHFLDLLESANL